MRNRKFDNDVNAAAELLYQSAGGGDAMLRRVVESVRTVTGGSHAYVMQRAGVGREGVVMAAAGLGGPQLADRLEPPAAAPPRRIVIPLSLDGALVGSVVADGIGRPLEPEAQRELALLAGVAARALQSHSLVDEAERQASREVQRQFQLLSGTIFHLKRALSQVSESLELLESEAQLAEEHQDHVMRGRRNLGTALRLLSELHELGRTDAGRLVPRRELIDLDVLIRELVREYQMAGAGTGVQFALDVGDLPVLNTDAGCVRHVLDNLLSNALRYAPPASVVTVRALMRPGRREEDPGSWIRIDVVDRGPGVAEGEAVFEEVQRVHRTGVPGFRLAISRRIARLLRGNLTLQTALQGGSTFTLWLPVD